MRWTESIKIMHEQLTSSWVSFRVNEWTEGQSERLERWSEGPVCEVDRVD